MPALYLLRHGVPRDRGVLLGQFDSPLAAAPLLKPPEVAAVYTSPLTRARQTADALGLNYCVIDDLREITYGSWDGRTWDEIEQRWPDIAHRKVANWFGVTPPGGESWSHFQHRVIQALDAVVKGPMPALIVSHEAVHSVITAKLAGADPHKFKQGYGELISLSADPSAAE